MASRSQDSNGNDEETERTEILVTNSSICVGCRRSFTEAEVAEAKRGEIKSGPFKGRPVLKLMCPDCGQKNTVIRAKGAGK